MLKAKNIYKSFDEIRALDNVTILPATAVSAVGEVMVLGQGDRLEALNVKVLRKQGDAVIVAIGKLSGREVILERAPQLGAGIKVDPRRTDNTPLQVKTTGG